MLFPRTQGPCVHASEGINGTLAGPADAVNQYVATLKTDKRFADLDFKVSAGDTTTFPKLVVKVRREIVTLNAGEIAPDQDNQLSAAEWKRKMEDEPDTVLLDIQNGLNGRRGSLKMRSRAEIENFRDLPGYVEQVGTAERKDRADVLHGRNSL